MGGYSVQDKTKLDLLDLSSNWGKNPFLEYLGNMPILTLLFTPCSQQVFLALGQKEKWNFKSISNAFKRNHNNNMYLLRSIRLTNVVYFKLKPILIFKLHLHNWGKRCLSFCFSLILFKIHSSVLFQVNPLQSKRPNLLLTQSIYFNNLLCAHHCIRIEGSLNCNSPHDL